MMKILVRSALTVKLLFSLIYRCIFNFVKSIVALQ